MSVYITEENIYLHILPQIQSQPSSAGEHIEVGSLLVLIQRIAT